MVQNNRIWLIFSVILFWLSSHLCWLVWFPESTFNTLLAGYALQNAVFAWGALVLTTHWQTRFSKVLWLTTKIIPGLFILAVSAWIGHITYFLMSETPQLHILNSLAVFVTAGLFITLWGRYGSQQTTFIYYSVAMIIALTMGYLRVAGWGFTPFTVWDTAGLMGTSYILLALQSRWPSSPLYRLTLFIPILALFTVPWQLQSSITSSVLLAVAALYLLTSHRSRQTFPFYLGMIAINLGCYLWIPNLAQTYQLFHLYTIPAATTVLLMLELHHLELKPSTAHVVRICALSALYAGATVDVFLHERLSIFLLALFLSFSGIALGIALRVRAFVYTGIIFLIFNVMGQLLRFYPEGRLEKAIVLMVIGGSVTGVMIWFNLQRETWLRRLQGIRTQITHWK